MSALVLTPTSCSIRATPLIQAAPVLVVPAEVEAQHDLGARSATLVAAIQHQRRAVSTNPAPGIASEELEARSGWDKVGKGLSNLRETPQVASPEVDAFDELGSMSPYDSATYFYGVPPLKYSPPSPPPRPSVQQATYGDWQNPYQPSSASQSNVQHYGYHGSSQHETYNSHASYHQEASGSQPQTKKARTDDTNTETPSWAKMKENARLGVIEKKQPAGNWNFP